MSVSNWTSSHTGLLKQENAESKQRVFLKIEFNSKRISLGHHYCRYFFVLEYLDGDREVKLKPSNTIVILSPFDQGKFIL